MHLQKRYFEDAVLTLLPLANLPGMAPIINGIAQYVSRGRSEAEPETLCRTLVLHIEFLDAR